MKISNFKFQTEIILTISIIAYVVLFSYLSINRYLSLNSHYFDLGIMDQVVYNSSKGRFLEMTNQDFKKNISRLAVHFDPILVVFAPFYTIYEDPRILLIVQTILLAVGAWLIYLIGLKVLKNKNYALIFAVSYLMFFPVGRANLFDFHAVTLATTFILCAIYFNLKRQNLLSFLFIALSLFTKENVGLVTFFLGTVSFLFQKRKKIWFDNLHSQHNLFCSSGLLHYPIFQVSKSFCTQIFWRFRG